MNQDIKRRHRKSKSAAPSVGIGPFEHLQDLFPAILKVIPIGLLIDTVRRLDPPTYFRYFKGFRPQSLGRNRVTNALFKEVFERKNAAVADLINLLWNQSNRKLYKAMHELVKQINENVEEIESIEDQRANEMIDTLLKDFSRQDIYLCVRMNEVKFSEEVIQDRLVKGNDDWKPKEAQETKDEKETQDNEAAGQEPKASDEQPGKAENIEATEAESKDNPQA